MIFINSIFIKIFLLIFVLYNTASVPTNKLNMNTIVSTTSMTRSDLAALQELSFVKDLVSIERIPKSFMSDFDSFFFGKTLVKASDGILFAYPHDIRRWVKYLFVKYND